MLIVPKQWMMELAGLLVLLLLAVSTAFKHQSRQLVQNSVKTYGSVGGARWGNEPCFECEVLGDAPDALKDMEQTIIPENAFYSIGDFHEQPTPEEHDDLKRKASFNMNVGKAMEVLRNQLPFVFSSSNLDFSIFAEQMTVTDHRSNRAAMPKSIYVAAVKSLRVAGALSTLFPSMNVKKIEYIESNGFIQCLVDVVLPDNVRVDGQAVWEGMFYFGLNEEGLIDSHVFDRQITNFTPQAQISKMPWLRPSVAVEFPNRLVYNSDAQELEWPDLLMASSE